MVDFSQSDSEKAVGVVAEFFGLKPDLLLNELCSDYQGYLYDLKEMDQDDEEPNINVFYLVNAARVAQEIRDGFRDFRAS